MKPEIEIEEVEIANKTAAKCPNLHSAWASGKAQSEEPCYCPSCLSDRAQLTLPIPPAPYIGSKRRCRICGAVDGVPYPRFLQTLMASTCTDVCELYRSLCNRLPCK